MATTNLHARAVTALIAADNQGGGDAFFSVATVSRIELMPYYRADDMTSILIKTMLSRRSSPLDLLSPVLCDPPVITPVCSTPDPSGWGLLRLLGLLRRLLFARHLAIFRVNDRFLAGPVERVHEHCAVSFIGGVSWSNVKNSVKILQAHFGNLVPNDTFLVGQGHTSIVDSEHGVCVRIWEVISSLGIQASHPFHKPMYVLVSSVRIRRVRDRPRWDMGHNRSVRGGNDDPRAACKVFRSDG